MKLFHLGRVPWLQSQLLYHAQPRLGVEALNILAPSSPYVCIGYHQDAQQEVDLAYCQDHAIPVFRREVGGGAVYLDGNQVFYQLVLHKDNPLAQGDKASFYRRMLQPVVETYADLGVPTVYRPINDIVTAEGRKISGNGAATIGDYVVLVGNLIADFDYDTMVRVLRVPDEKYRDKVYKSMRENLTTLRRETGRVPEWNEMATPLIQRFEQVLGRLQPAAMPDSVYAHTDTLKAQFLSDEWLHKKGKRSSGREVRISSRVQVVQRVYKAPGGLLRATLELVDDRLTNVTLSGDFFCYPATSVEALEHELEGAQVGQVNQLVTRFYEQRAMESPGVTPQDWSALLAP